MRAINHALTGAIIGFTIGEPLIAIPAAVASHFVLDVIPHHGLDVASKPKLLRTNTFKYMLYIDAVACIALVIVLVTNQPVHWLLAAICAFAGAAPDMLSFNRYRQAIRHKPWHSGWYSRFASGIQWFEHPIGAVVEVVWFIAALILIAPFFK